MVHLNELTIFPTASYQYISTLLNISDSNSKTNQLTRPRWLLIHVHQTSNVFLQDHLPYCTYATSSPGYTCDNNTTNYGDLILSVPSTSSLDPVPTRFKQTILVPLTMTPLQMCFRTIFSPKWSLRSVPNHSSDVYPLTIGPYVLTFP